jgi:hypothetical protein
MNRAFMLVAVSVICLISNILALAQNQDSKLDKGGTCPAPIYQKDEVSQAAVIISIPEPELPLTARIQKVTGLVVLSVVFCADGKVRDIKVLQGLSLWNNGKSSLCSLADNFSTCCQRRSYCFANFSTSIQPHKSSGAYCEYFIES